MNNALQGELSEDPVIICGEQAYNREDKPTECREDLPTIGKTLPYNREGESCWLI